MLERRKQQRWPAFWAGRISFTRSNSVTECLVRNTSEAGAKLVMRGAVFVPREFDLNIPKHGADYRAKVIWRRSEQLGVAFERIEAVDPAVRAAEARRLRQLQREAAALGIREPMTPMALLRQLKKLRQQNASLRRRLLLQTD
jgi:PilZ domain-containing protein